MFKIGCAVIGCWLLATGVAMAQFQPFTILSNNSDIQNTKLYVEVMYQKPACGHYQAMFKLVDRVGTTLNLTIDSVMSSVGTYEISSNKRALMYPKAGGYKLRFNLPAGAKPGDSIKVYVESFKLAYRCSGCGSAGSDVIFEPKHVKSGCPFHDKDILLACNQQKGKAGNWEAWIQDSRDCNPYRIVQMPDGSWWFAQNLNYQVDLTQRNAASQGGNGVGSFWCPGAQGGNTAYDLLGCKAYGALYTWSAVMSLDGRGSVVQNEAGFSQRSKVRGICPEGWFVPGFYDWGAMLNSVEAAADTNHNHRNHLVASLGDKGRVAGKRLKSTLSCAAPDPDGNWSQGVQAPCATSTLPAWTYYLDHPRVTNSTRFSDDFYGLGLLAAGRRNSAEANGFDKSPGTDAYYWSATQVSATEGAARELNAANNTVAYGIANKDQVAYSVRCVAAQ